MATPIPLAPDVFEPFEVRDEGKVKEDIVKDVQPLPKAILAEEHKVEDIAGREPEFLIEPESPKTEGITQLQEPLEELADIDRLAVTRRLKVRGVLAMKGKKNRYFVRTADHRLLFNIEEQNRMGKPKKQSSEEMLEKKKAERIRERRIKDDLVLREEFRRKDRESWWVGYFCYGLRPLQLRVTNCAGVEVMRISRPFAFTTRVLPFQLQRLQVYSPPGHLIGTVAQQWTAIKPVYIVRDSNDNDVFVIHGPRCTLGCFQDVRFQITRPDGTLVGGTNKRWQGLTHALFFAPITDTFGLQFLEKSITREEKALLLATALLFDYMYYDL